MCYDDDTLCVIDSLIFIKCDDEEVCSWKNLS